MCARTFPNYFTSKILMSKNSIKNNLQIMACGRVAMEIEGTGRFEDAVKFEEAVGHHGEIGHHVIRSEELSERDHHLGDIGMLALLEFGKFPLGLLTPMPAIFEGGDLRVGLVSLRRFEEYRI